MRSSRNVRVDCDGENELVVLAIEVIEVVLKINLSVSQITARGSISNSLAISPPQPSNLPSHGCWARFS